MKERISWLQLSDLHLSSTEGNYDAFFNALKQLIEEDLLTHGERIDYIVIPGDIVEKNDSNAYSLAKTSIESIANWAGISGEAVILTPGNHDVSWSETNGIIELQLMTNARESLIPFTIPEADLRKMAGKFSGFYQFAEGINHKCWNKDHFFTTFTFDDVDFAFIALNTCILNCEKIDHAGFVFDQQVRGALGEVEELKRQIPICYVGHHPLSDFVTPPRRDLPLEMLLERGSVYCGGHEHTTIRENYSRDMLSAITLLQTANISGEKGGGVAPPAPVRGNAPPAMLQRTTIDLNTYRASTKSWVWASHKLAVSEKFEWFMHCKTLSFNILDWVRLCGIDRLVDRQNQVSALSQLENALRNLRRPFAQEATYTTKFQYRQGGLASEYREEYTLVNPYDEELFYQFDFIPFVQMSPGREREFEKQLFVDSDAVSNEVEENKKDVTVAGQGYEWMRLYQPLTFAPKGSHRIRFIWRLLNQDIFTFPITIKHFTRGLIFRVIIPEKAIQEKWKNELAFCLLTIDGKREILPIPRISNVGGLLTFERVIEKEKVIYPQSWFLIRFLIVNP